MAECKLCGKKKVVQTAEIEGAVIKVCDDCLKFGRKVVVPKKSPKKKFPPKMDLPETILVRGYGKLITKKRMKMGLERKEFAKRINEKESLIKRIELEQMRPDDKLVRKIESFLGIKLITEYEAPEVKVKKKKGTLTLGDIVSLE